MNTTVQMARRHRKPYLCLDLAVLDEAAAAEQISEWLASDAFAGDLFTAAPERIVLNVAGSRESKAPGIQRAVAEVMGRVLG